MATELMMRAGLETWAIRDTALADILSVEVEESRIPRKLPRVEGNVVVLPVHGMISQRASIWSRLFGGTSTQQLAGTLQKLAEDARVGAVVLDIDSPGGTVSGVSEAADAVWEASQQKPVAAISNSQMASAAYWLGSQVGSGQQRLVAAPGSDTGSIGVFRLHENIAGVLEQAGIEITLIAEPGKKMEGNPYQPLTEEALEHHKGQVHATYEEFVDAVARGRGVRASTVRTGYGEGRVYHASQAAEMGLVDRVATLPQLLGELGVGSKSQLSQAEADELLQDVCAMWNGERIQPFMPQPHKDISRERRVRMKYICGV